MDYLEGGNVLHLYYLTNPPHPSYGKRQAANSNFLIFGYCDVLVVRCGYTPNHSQSL